MPTKKWVARILWWRGKNSRPRKNQQVASRFVKAKSLEELAGKIARARKRSWEMLESGGRQDPGGYFTALLTKKVAELSKSEKEVHIEAILGFLSVHAGSDKSKVLRPALTKLSTGELALLLAEIKLLCCAPKSIQAPSS